jgi:hypothetical protein
MQGVLLIPSLTFLYQPATSVEAERVFSEGRNQVQWNQESLSSQTFRAEMSMGAWTKAPWFNIDRAVQLIASRSSRLRTKGCES